MDIIQIKEIEFNQDDRGWFIRPITDDDIKSRIVCDVHMVSIKPGGIRGNHYHVYKTENILVIGSACRVIVVDNCTKKKEETTIGNTGNILLVIPPDVTHAIENIGNDVAYLLCFSNVKEDLESQDIVKKRLFKLPFAILRNTYSS